ncbi:MAG TPA: hypothetical protein VL860_14130 [Planctomycetota bacterium]|nr:hypothetical protein [Planctomycetota bacterium]
MKKKLFLLTLLGAFVVGAIAALAWRRVASGVASEHITQVRPTRLQNRPPIKISDSKLVAAKRTSINMFTRGTIDFVAEDNTVVHKGDKLASVEPKDTEDDMQKAQIDLSNEQANLRQAIANRDDQMPRLATNEKAERAKLELAELKVQRLLEQPDPLDWKSQRESARLAQTRWSIARQDADNVAALFSQGFASQAELRAKENALAKSTISMSGMGIDTRSLLAGAPLSQVALADLARRRSELSLENLILSQANQRENLLSAIVQEDAAIRYYKDRIAKIQDDLNKHLIFAPHDGLVELVSRHGQSTKIGVGDRIWNGMSVMMLTDLHQMRVRGVMHENFIRMVTPGETHATVTIPSNPGRRYKGVVSWIDRWAKDKGAVDDSAERHEIGMSGVEVFNFYVDILDVDEDNLKPGRVAWVEIEPDSTGPVLALPRGAIVEQDGKSFVRVVAGEERTLKEVSVINLDEHSVQVLSGIDENTTVEMKE